MQWPCNYWAQIKIIRSITITADALELGLELGISEAEEKEQPENSKRIEKKKKVLFCRV